MRRVTTRALFSAHPPAYSHTGMVKHNRAGSCTYPHRKCASSWTATLGREAALFFVLEEIRVASPDSRTLVEHILRESAEYSDSDVNLLRSRIKLAIAEGI